MVGNGLCEDRMDWKPYSRYRLKQQGYGDEDWRTGDAGGVRCADGALLRARRAARSAATRGVGVSSLRRSSPPALAIHPALPVFGHSVARDPAVARVCRG